MLDIPAADVTAIEAGDADGDGTDDIRLLTVNGVIFLTRQSDGTFAVADEVGLPATANASALLTFEEEETGETSTTLVSAMSLNNTISLTPRLSEDSEPVDFVGEVSINLENDSAPGDRGVIATGDIDNDGNSDIASIVKDGMQGQVVRVDLFEPTWATGDFDRMGFDFLPDSAVSIESPIGYGGLDIPSSTSSGSSARVALAAPRGPAQNVWGHVENVWGHVVFRAFGGVPVCGFFIIRAGYVAAAASTAEPGRPASASSSMRRATSWASPTSR